MLSQLGLPDRDTLIAGQALTDAQISKLLGYTLQQSIKDAKQLFPNFDELSESAQMALTDISFNLGARTLSQFTTFRGLVLGGDLQGAANDLLTTAYAHQLPGRAAKNAQLLIG